MKKKTLFMTALISAVIASSIFGAGVAYAGYTESSQWAHTTNGLAYHQCAALESYPKYYMEPETWLKPTNKNAPDGWFGGKQRLYNVSGTLHSQSSWGYNGYVVSQNVWHGTQMYVGTSSSGTSFYSCGVSAHWNGSSYDTYNTWNTPNLTTYW